LGISQNITIDFQFHTQLPKTKAFLQSKMEKKRGNGPLIAIIALGILALAGGGIGAAVWYTTSHKAAQKAALVSQSPLVFPKPY
jgi:flagellar basal body-associated protein FliL